MTPSASGGASQSLIASLLVASQGGGDTTRRDIRNSKKARQNVASVHDEPSSLDSFLMKLEDMKLEAEIKNGPRRPECDQSNSLNYGL